MRRIEVDELKELQLSILKYVNDYCNKNDIKYWIDGGTLLGAVRHKGYIPWDDDIDIGMLREDYEKFMNTFNMSQGRYKFACAENDKVFNYAYGKVLDTLTVLYEPDQNGKKIAINIDVFVYDNAPGDNKKLNYMYNKRDFLQLLSDVRSQKTVVGTSLKAKALHHFVRLFPQNFFSLMMIKNSKRYMLKSCENVGNFTGYTRMKCNKSVFDSLIDIEFEGITLKAPIGYDQWLKSFYGDYMILPPVDKRVSHHLFEAFYVDTGLNVD